MKGPGLWLTGSCRRRHLAHTVCLKGTGEQQPGQRLRRVVTLRDGLRTWMEVHGYVSVTQMKGSMSQRNVADPTAFERANYIKTLESYKGDYS